MRDVGFISTDDPRWVEALDRISHDVYHRPEYVQLAAATVSGQASAFLWRVGERWALVPLVVRDLPASASHILGDIPSTIRGFGPNQQPRWCDGVSPYGYGGPISNAPGHCEEEVFYDLMRHARLMGLVTLFLRAHPVLSSAFRPFQGDCSIAIGTTYSISLKEAEQTISSESNEEKREELRTTSLLNRYRSSYRQEIRKLLRDSSIEYSLNDWRHLPSFASLYRQNMANLGADPSYFFSDTYFRDSHMRLPNRVFLLSATREGQFIGGVMLYGCRHNDQDAQGGGIAQYHLTAYQDEWRVKGLPKGLVHKAALWASRQGYQNFHLGGGLGGQNDSLAHFKQGFHPHPHHFRVYRLVTDNDGYQRIVDRLAPQERDYFPIYRNSGGQAARVGAGEAREGKGSPPEQDSETKGKCPGRESNSHSVARTGF